MDTFSAPVFSDEQKARRYLERLRWPKGPLCPRCGSVDHAYEIKPAGVYRVREPEMPSQFHRHRQHGDGTQPHRAA